MALACGTGPAWCSAVRLHGMRLLARGACCVALGTWHLALGTWHAQMTEYTVPGGKLNRGLTVVHSLGLIVDRELTAEELNKAGVLGWCIEWVRARTGVLL